MPLVYLTMITGNYYSTRRRVKQVFGALRVKTKICQSCVAAERLKVSNDNILI